MTAMKVVHWSSPGRHIVGSKYLHQGPLAETRIDLLRTEPYRRLS
jgi:hypothetical protein